MQFGSSRRIPGVVLALVVLAATVAGIAARPGPATALSPTAYDLAASWGDNQAAQLGNDLGPDRKRPTQIAGPGPWKYVTGHTAGGIGLRPDATVWTWGSDLHGQLGDGPTSPTTLAAFAKPTQISGLADVKAIAAAYNHILVLKNDGTVWGWGDNSLGALGVAGSQIDTPTQVPGLANIKAIAVGFHTSFAVTTTGGLLAWGYNSSGQLCLGDTTNRATPTTVANVTNASSVAAGNANTYILRSTGAVASCGAASALGTGSPNPSSSPVTVTAVTNATAIISGNGMAGALKSDGTVLMWGFNGQGQLGKGDISNSSVPVSVTGLSGPVIALAAGEGHVVALMADNSLMAWGANSDGQLGVGNTTNRTTATALPGSNNVLNIGAGGTNSFMVGIPGELRVTTSPAVNTQILLDGLPMDSWGLAWVPVIPGYHELTVTEVAGFTKPALAVLTVTGGTTTTAVATFAQNGTLRVITSPAVNSPVSVDGLPRNAWGMWTDLPAGSHQVCFGGVNNFTAPACQTANLTGGALTTITGSFVASAGATTNTMIGWGENSTGQLAYRTDIWPHVPDYQPSSHSSSYSDVAAGLTHTLLRRPDGQVLAVGSNGAGELGSSGPTTVVTQLVPGLTSVVGIAAGYGASAAVRADGSVWTWGDAALLGDGSVANRATPAAVPGLSGITQVSLGYSHALARKSDGTVWGWGANGAGQLGSGLPINDISLTPVQVAGLTNVTSVVAGEGNSYAIRSDGTVMALGTNNNGELGNGTTTSSATPVAVFGLTGVQELAAGDDFAIARMADGSVRTWGENGFGQLGNSSTTDSSLPVTPIGVAAARVAAAGVTAAVITPTGAALTWGANQQWLLGANLDPADVPKVLQPVQVARFGRGAALAGRGLHFVALVPPGELRVVTNPPLPTQISVNGTPADSWGITWLPLASGSHTVSFGHIEGFTEPTPATATVFPGLITNVVGNFVQRGSLRVILNPSVAGTIFVDGQPRNKYGMWTDLPTGSHEVCFGPVTGLTAPACQTVTLTAGNLTTVTGVYT